MHLLLSQSFNLNLLECKFFVFFKFIYANAVLISTYWNVNPTNWEIKPKSVIVLISTYWNVNVQMKYDFEGLVAF